MTLACENSRSFSLPYQLLSVLTVMLLTLEQNISHVVDAGTKQRQCCRCWTNTRAVFSSIFIRPKFHIALLCPSVRQSVLLLNFVQSCYMDFSKLLDEFFKIDNGFLWCVTWICQNWYKYFMLLHGFVKIDTGISPSCYLDLSKLLQGFVKVVT